MLTWMIVGSDGWSGWFTDAGLTTTLKPRIHDAAGCTTGWTNYVINMSLAKGLSPVAQP